MEKDSEETTYRPHKDFAVYVTSKPELVNYISPRQDLEVIPIPKQVDNDGNCLHVARAWKMVPYQDGLTPIRCCRDCDKEWREELDEQIEEDRLLNRGW